MVFCLRLQRNVVNVFCFNIFKEIIKKLLSINPQCHQVSRRFHVRMVETGSAVTLYA